VREGRHLLGEQVVREVGDREIAALRHGAHQHVHDRVRAVVSVDVGEDAEQQDGHWLREVEQGPRVCQDLARIAQVRVDVTGGSGRGAGEHRMSMQQDDRIVVDVHDAGLRRDRLRDVVCVVVRRQAGPDVQELPYPGLASQVTHRACQERPVGAHRGNRFGEGLDGGLRGLPVHCEVVLAAQPEVEDPGRVRHADIEPGQVKVMRRCATGRFAYHAGLAHALFLARLQTKACFCTAGSSDPS